MNNQQAISQIARFAHENGLSYGQQVAQGIPDFLQETGDNQQPQPKPAKKTNLPPIKCAYCGSLVEHPRHGQIYCCATCKRLGQIRWTDEMHDEFVRLIEARTPIDEIAAHLGLTVQQCLNRANNKHISIRGLCTKKKAHPDGNPK